MNIGPANIAAILYKNMKKFFPIILRVAFHPCSIAPLTEFTIDLVVTAMAAPIVAPQDNILYVTTQPTIVKINIILERCLL